MNLTASWLCSTPPRFSEKHIYERGINVALPMEFYKRMEAQLGEEYRAFLDCMAAPPVRGARLNPLKCDRRTLEGSLPFPLRPTPFSELSYYVDAPDKFGPLPAHHAGMFYSQEPSAAAAATALDPQPGEKILDLCASPGGKSTQIAGLMMGKGLLWANEAVMSRTGQLLSNLERLGVPNAVASCCHPDKLCKTLQGYFDRVLVDAPCSGEGLFRRNPEAGRQWSPAGVQACARRQSAILDSAALAVKEGGVLVYSTCTFSQEENEAVVKKFLQSHREFVAEEIPAPFGRPSLDGGPARRIYPMDGGEGHFIARFRRMTYNECRIRGFSGYFLGDQARSGRALYEELFTDDCPEDLFIAGDKLLILPADLPEINGLNVLRAGVELASLHTRRLEPAHGVFVSHSGTACREVMDFAPDDPELLAFLRGEEISTTKRGYPAVCVNGVPLGFGKASQGRLKNHYPKGLRNNSQ